MDLSELGIICVERGQNSRVVESRKRDMIESAVNAVGGYNMVAILGALH